MTERAFEHARSHRIREYFRHRFDRAEHIPNPLFAGRDRLVASILRDVRRLQQSPVPLKNLSTVLFGAPGSGKSETLNHLRSRMEAIGAQDNPIWVVSGGADELTDALAFAEMLEDQIERGPKALLGNLADRGGGFSIGGIIGATLGPDTRPELRSETARMRRFARELNAMDPRPTIVLLIDEAQNKLAVAGAQKDRLSFCQPFHDAKIDLKVMPVYAGLGNTPGELKRCGLSRLSGTKRHLMERLDSPDVRNMARTALRAMASQSSDTVDEWAETIARNADGWPMHLSHQLGAVAGVAESRDWTLDTDDFKAAMGEADRLRADYYNDRLESAASALEPKHYRAWAGLFDGREFVTAERMAEAVGGADDASALAATAVHAGLVEERDPGRYVAPIPSLIAHIAASGKAYERAAKPRGPGR